MQQIKQAAGVGKPSWRKTACGVCVLCAAAAVASPAQTFTTLHSFDGTDGALPSAGLIQATNGKLYGTALEGGAKQKGTVFTITASGALTVLHSFCSQGFCTDGEYPQAALVQATSGEFYGTAYSDQSHGVGTVFKITLSGTLTTIYKFCSQSDCADGENPRGGLVQGADGDFYGTTEYGGANGSFGTVFKITPTGALTTLYSFCSQSNCTDGVEPYAGLIQATDGNFYGTTVGGGANGSNTGTVFKITPSGALTTLYSFCSQSVGQDCTDGAYPYAALVQAIDGNFYGTTFQGGANTACSAQGCGTVFKITPSGTLTTLYSFCSQSGCTDGGNAYAGLIQATDGNFYGTTVGGGANSYGTVFKITRSGALTTLYSFCSHSGCPDGDGPLAALAQATNGNFYGTAAHGGAHGDGTIFSLSVGLGPFVETQPTSTKVGAGVRVLGTNLTGVTSVTFNGTPALFKVVSSSFISTTVPVGATTGNVQVVTPGGTLTSNVPFRVLP